MFGSLSQVRKACHEFFHTPETPYALCLMRIMMPLVMMAMILPRWPHARELYSSDGAPAQLGLGYGILRYVPEFSGTVMVALMTLLVLTMITACIGWCTRASLITCFVIYTYLGHLDAVSTMTKYSVITSHVLLLLALAPSGALWSVDAWVNRRRRNSLSVLPPEFPAWPRRCLQLLIGCVYFGAAMTKINTPAFLSGDQLLFWMLTHINFRHPLGEFLSQFPVLLKAMGFVTLVWEMTFIFLVWRGFWRPWVLAIGILFHFMTVLTLGLMIFPVVCFTTYVAFVDEEEFHAIRHWCRGQLRRFTALAATWSRWRLRVQQAAPIGWQGPAQLAFAMTCLIAMVGGVGLEYWLDPYGERRPEGRHQLATLDPDIVRQMLNESTELRDEDKFFSVELGTFLIGDLLADRQRVFRPGERVIVQCNLNPPHEDLWVECRIHDADDRLVDRMGNVALREMFRTDFFYTISRLQEPGDYHIVIRTGGKDVLRKQFRIVGGDPAVAAK